VFGLGIGYRGDHLDAMFQVSGHPISAADIQFIVTTVCKPKDAAVLEKTTHEASHRDVL
jgi:TRAP-type uncharacterized transport system substrate-binding protein